MYYILKTKEVQIPYLLFDSLVQLGYYDYRRNALW